MIVTTEHYVTLSAQVLLFIVSAVLVSGPLLYPADHPSSDALSELRQQRDQAKLRPRRVIFNND